MRLPETRSLNKGDNIVPLINIVFLLLVFFLLAGTLMPRPPFDMETATTELKPPSDAPADAVFVSQSGAVAYRGREMSVQAVAATLAAERGGVTETPLEIVLDRRLKAEALFPIMEALSGAGIDRVRVVTERSGAP